MIIIPNNKSNFKHELHENGVEKNDKYFFQDYNLRNVNISHKHAVIYLFFFSHHKIVFRGSKGGYIGFSYTNCIQQCDIIFSVDPLETTN